MAAALASGGGGDAMDDDEDGVGADTREAVAAAAAGAAAEEEDEEAAAECEAGGGAKKRALWKWSCSAVARQTAASQVAAAARHESAIYGAFAGDLRAMLGACEVGCRMLTVSKPV